MTGAAVPDDGLDAPGVVRNLFLAAAAGLLPRLVSPLALAAITFGSLRPTTLRVTREPGRIRGARS